MSEATLHAAVAQYLNLALPADAIWHHSPNEGKRGWRAQAAIKREGVRAGWPDIEIVWQGRVYFIELKAPKRNLSPAQKALHPRLRAAGALVMTCRTPEEVETILSLWGVPLRARLKVDA